MRRPLILTQVLLLYFEEFYIKDERCIWGNRTWRAALAIAKAWRNNEASLASDTHPLDSFIQTLDHLTAA